MRAYSRTMVAGSFETTRKQSSGSGVLQASLGGQALGTASLRAGNNDVRWTLPKALLAGLRRSASAGGNVLKLTPLSPSGSMAGAAVTRAVAVDPAKTKKHHAR